MVACATPAEPTPTPPADISAVVDVWEQLSGADASTDHNAIVEVWNTLDSCFVERETLDVEALGAAAIDAMTSQATVLDQPDSEHLSLVAIEAMLDVVDDPYTTFFTPDEYALYSEDSEGKFGGIGATVGLKDERITITAPLPDTPAERAGIRPGDVILAVDGESTEGWTVTESVLRIRGPEGTPVRLRVLHEGAEEPVEIEIVRGTIEITSVEWRLLPDGIAHVEISSFSSNTDEQMTATIEKAIEMGVRAMILDLRNNPGGLLSTTVNIASQFLVDGLVLYSVDGNDHRIEYEVRPDGLAPDIPLVVLVNNGSASGSEVLAGALRDHDRAVLIGENTFGKGSVNLPHNLVDGSGLYCTIGRWYSPDGHLIEGEGLAPDIEVEPGTDEDQDLQLDRAVEYLQSQVAAGAP
ncbi:MAG: S41 family peptidase [Chloroflexota bacterium]|nr:S41 family peptidase [Chloroflexota bacterium]MDE2942076.1 S41 family peptidase [Chloroflexota bacterium]MDE3268144.1 S41 family peptidase [Chloroflexota bacterium]